MQLNHQSITVFTFNNVRNTEATQFDKSGDAKQHSPPQGKTMKSSNQTKITLHISTEIRVSKLKKQRDYINIQEHNHVRYKQIIWMGIFQSKHQRWNQCIKQ